MLKEIMYGTENYVSYFVQATSEEMDGVFNCKKYGSFLNEEKARKFADELAEMFKVPVQKIN
ncbi:MAG: hypothetical protein M0Q88_08010 [Bacilli bacterium]|nr:hypothetical protein [Bacilli bacterium]